METGLSNQTQFFIDNPEKFQEPGIVKTLQLFISDTRITATSKVGGNFIGFEEYQVLASENLKFQTIKHILQGLQLNNYTYDEVVLFYQSPKFSILPISIIDSKEHSVAFEVNNQLEKGERIISNDLNSDGLTLLFSIPDLIYNVFNQLYPYGKIKHTFESINLISQNTLSQYKYSIFIELLNQTLIIYINKEYKFIAYNNFETANKTDIIYFISALLEAQEIDKSQCELFISKHVSIKVEDDLKEYFHHISLLHSTNNFSDSFTNEIIEENSLIFA